MQLIHGSLSILNQLNDLVFQLKSGEYSAELELLSGNSIGKHIRHVLEFFGLLLESVDGKIISYDDRNHDILLETDKNAAIAMITDIINRIKSLDRDKHLILKASYSKVDEHAIKLETSLNRELAYNIEHAIHHMAIIKIAVRTVFPSIDLSKDFGVAYSTIRYQKAT